MKRRDFFVIFCAILGYYPAEKLKLATIYPSIVMPGPDNNVNCISIYHNQRMDGARVANKRLLGMI